jgi:hypothetical protein
VTVVATGFGGPGVRRPSTFRSDRDAFEPPSFLSEL